MTTNEFDPTTNRIPFGLLSKDERKALMDWPHGWEFWWEDNWDSLIPDWVNDSVYRGKPKPVVTSVYRNIAPKRDDFLSRADADHFARQERIAVLRIDTCNGVSTAHLEEV